MQKVDVCIITKDKSNLNLEPIQKFIPYNKIIIEVTKGRGFARQKCIEQVSTDVFAFIDDDVTIHSSWFKEMMFWLEKLGSKVGAVTGVPELHPLSDARYYLKLKNDLGIPAPVKVNALHTGSCLIRKEAVKGIKFPKWLQHREDLFLTESIIKKGYECWRVPVKFKHFAGGSWKSLYAENTANLRLLGKWSYRTVFHNCLKSWYVALKIFFKFHESLVFILNLRYCLATLHGFFNPLKYRRVERLQPLKIFNPLTKTRITMIIPTRKTYDNFITMKNLGALKFEVIVCRHKGVGKARNKGASHAHGEILVFLEDDLTLNLDRLLKLLHSWKPKTVITLHETQPKHPMIGRITIISKEDFMYAGKFNEYIRFGGEGADFIMRCMDKGLKWLPIISNSFYKHLNRPYNLKIELTRQFFSTFVLLKWKRKFQRDLFKFWVSAHTFPSVHNLLFFFVKVSAFYFHTLKLLGERFTHAFKSA